MYLDALLPPVLHCLDDAESRVRYYACESLYNIAKVRFDEPTGVMFRVLCLLISFSPSVGSYSYQRAGSEGVPWL